MGALATAIEKAAPRKGPQCWYPGVRAALGKADRADLDTALANPLVPGSAIAAGLRSVGHQFSDQTVNRHRQGRCGCPR